MARDATFSSCGSLGAGAPPDRAKEGLVQARGGGSAEQCFRCGQGARGLDGGRRTCGGAQMNLSDLGDCAVVNPTVKSSKYVFRHRFYPLCVCRTLAMGKVLCLSLPWERGCV